MTAIISDNVPNHLVVGAQTGFLNSTRERQMDWSMFVQPINLGSKESTLVDLGGAPMPTNSPGGTQIQAMIERSIVVYSDEWDITIHVSKNAVDDDQTGGSIDRKARGAGSRFQQHINKISFEALNAGDAAASLGYDGVSFFDASHVDDGAAYQTAQDNEYALALSNDNFNTVWANAALTRDDQGEFTEYIYDLLVVHPSQRKLATQITDNPNDGDTANRAINPFAGEVRYITSPYLDSSAWMLLATQEQHKPLLLAMREMPVLQSAWFEPKRPGGGWFMFKFYARYDIFYGDWRLAYLGNT